MSKTFIPEKTTTDVVIHYVHKFLIMWKKVLFHVWE